MASTVEVIIKAVDKYSSVFKKAETGFTRLTNGVRAVGKAIKDIGVATGIATAALYGIGRAIESIADRAAALGQGDVLQSVTAVKDQFQELVDQILTTNLPTGGTVLDLIKSLADGLLPSLRAIGVVLQAAASGFELFVNDMRFAFSQISVLTGGVESYTAATHEAEKARIMKNAADRIGVIWEGKLTETVIAQNAAINRQTHSVKSLSSAHKNLNQILSQRRAIEDAIRAGDARALADARGGSRGGRVEAGGVGGGRNMAVNVYVGNEPVDARVRTVYANEVVKPAMKGGSSGGKR